MRIGWPLGKVLAVLSSMGCGVVLSLSAGHAKAEIVQGQLELQWGDPQPAVGHSKRPVRFRATLIADSGKRHALDPSEARRAAGDLYALANRRVAVDFSTFKRGGAGRRIEAIVAADRLELNGKNDMAKLAEKSVLGNTRWVTIACKFSDIAEEQKPVSFFQGQYGSSAGQLGHYWKEVSYGKIDLAGSTAAGWFALPHPRSHYITETDGEEDADLDALFDDCTAAADAQVNFNGVQGINMMFNGDLDGYAWGGGSCGVLEGVNQCIRNTWNPPWAFRNLAPLAHEMGHGYGLPHSDNADNDDDTYDNPWDVMSDGWSNAVANPTYGALPKHINIKQRDRLGWVDAARKLTVAAGGWTNENVWLDYASLAGSVNRQMIVLSPPEVTSAPGVGVHAVVSYTVEARKRSGAYEAALAGDAVIIHGIDASGAAFSMDADNPPADVANNEGTMFKPGETWVSADGSRRVKVLSATPTGFIVTVGKRRLTGGPLPARIQTSAIASSAPVRQAPAHKPGPERECGDRRSRTTLRHCAERER